MFEKATISGVSHTIRNIRGGMPFIVTKNPKGCHMSKK